MKYYIQYKRNKYFKKNFFYKNLIIRFRYIDQFFKKLFMRYFFLLNFIKFFLYILFIKFLFYFFNTIQFIKIFLLFFFVFIATTYYIVTKNNLRMEKEYNINSSRHKSWSGLNIWILAYNYVNLFLMLLFRKLYQ